MGLVLIIAVYVYHFSKSCELTNKKRCVSSSTREFNLQYKKLIIQLYI